MKVLLASLLFLFISNSFAEDFRYYDVEVVVFENQTETAKNAEHWPLEVTINKPVNTVVLGEPPLTEWLPLDVDLEESFKVLGVEEYHLNEEAEKISQSKNKRVIFHAAWRQPGLDKKNAMSVYFKHDFTEMPLLQEHTPAPQETVSGLNKEQIGTVNSLILEGIFRVTLARYLHLEAELSYRKAPALAPEPELENIYPNFDVESITNNDERQGVVYLKQKRNRIRSNELHYIDHPVLGILVKMTPYFKADVETATPTLKTKTL